MASALWLSGRAAGVSLLLVCGAAAWGDTLPQAADATAAEATLPVATAPPSLTREEALVMLAGGTGANPTRAAELGWRAFVEAYDAWLPPSGGVLSLASEGGATSLSPLGEQAANLGFAMAFAHFFQNLSEGNTETAGLGLASELAQWAAGKWGWKLLRVASVAVGFLDYALQRTANAVLGERWQAWEYAYARYHNDQQRAGRRSLSDWRRVLERMAEQGTLDAPSFEREVHSYLDGFWSDIETAAYFDRKLQGEPPPREKEAIRDRYLHGQLLPWLQPLASRLADEAAEQMRREAGRAHERLRLELVRRRVLVVEVLAPRRSAAGREIEIGPWRGLTGTDGRYEFGYTLLGLSRLPWPPRVEVRHAAGVAGTAFPAPAANGRQTLVLPLYASLRAHVVDRLTGRPIGGAEVEAAGDQGSGRAVSGADGEAVLAELPFGMYRLTARAQGYETAMRADVLVQGAEPGDRMRTITGSIRLTPLAEPTGARPEILAPDGSPKGDGARTPPAPVDGSGTSVAAAEQDDTESLCRCIFQDRLDYETRPQIERKYPEMEAEVRIITPPRLDRASGRCVGRLQIRRRFHPWESWHEYVFDWSTTRMTNPPRRPGQGDACCTVVYQGKCWREWPD